MRPVIPAIGVAAAAITGETAGTALGLPDPLTLVIGLAGMSASLGAFVAAHASAVDARRRARRRERLRRALAEARCTLRLFEQCSDAELARLRELRRQVRHGERTVFPPS